MYPSHSLDQNPKSAEANSVVDSIGDGARSVEAKEEHAAVVKPAVTVSKEVVECNQWKVWRDTAGRRLVRGE